MNPSDLYLMPLSVEEQGDAYSIVDAKGYVVALGLCDLAYAQHICTMVNANQIPQETGGRGSGAEAAYALASQLTEALRQARAERDALREALKAVELCAVQARIASNITKKEKRADFLCSQVERIIDQSREALNTQRPALSQKP